MTVYIYRCWFFCGYITEGGYEVADACPVCGERLVRVEAESAGYAIGEVSFSEKRLAGTRDGHPVTDTAATCLSCGELFPTLTEAAHHRRETGHLTPWTIPSSWLANGAPWTLDALLRPPEPG